MRNILRPDLQSKQFNKKMVSMVVALKFRGNLSQFYHDLGVQILDVCYGTRPRNGGILDMVRAVI